MNSSKRYKVIAVIGKGSQGVVYKCQRTNSSMKDKDDLFAMKRMMVGSIDEANEAIQELNRVIRLRKHENIAEYIEVILDQQDLMILVSIIMKLYERDLDKFLIHRESEKKPLSEIEIIDIFSQMTEAVNFLHNQDVIHRDVKPSNMYYSSQDEKYVLGDFGLAANFKTSFKSSYCGSPYWIAPEVMNGNYDFKIDVFSLGVCLYNLVTTGKDKLFYLEVMKDETKLKKDIRNELKDSPQWIPDLILKMISLNPNERPTSEEVNNFMKEKSIGSSKQSQSQQQQSKNIQHIITEDNNNNRIQSHSAWGLIFPSKSENQFFRTTTNNNETQKKSINSKKIRSEKEERKRKKEKRRIRMKEFLELQHNNNNNSNIGSLLVTNNIVSNHILLYCDPFEVLVRYIWISKRFYNLIHSKEFLQKVYHFNIYKNKKKKKGSSSAVVTRKSLINFFSKYLDNWIGEKSVGSKISYLIQMKYNQAIDQFFRFKFMRRKNKLNDKNLEMIPKRDVDLCSPFCIQIDQNEPLMHYIARFNLTDILDIIIKNTSHIYRKIYNIESTTTTTENLENFIPFLFGNERDSDGNRNYAFHVAVFHGNEEIIERFATICPMSTLLMLRNRTYGQTAVHIASTIGKVEILKYLIEKDRQELGVQILVQEVDSDGFTPLHLAARKNNLGVCKLLLEYGAKKNARGPRGAYPYQLARNEKVIELLLVV